MESDCQQLLEKSADCQQAEADDYQQKEEFSDCQQLIAEVKRDDGDDVVSVLQLEVSEDQPEYPQIGKIIPVQNKSVRFRKMRSLMKSILESPSTKYANSSQKKQTITPSVPLMRF